MAIQIAAMLPTVHLVLVAGLVAGSVTVSNGWSGQVWVHGGLDGAGLDYGAT